MPLTLPLEFGETFKVAEMDGSQHFPILNSPAGGDAPSGDIAIDPVCGMQVNKQTAKHKLHHEGSDYYFCGRSCVDKFAADPARFLQAESKSHGHAHHGGPSGKTKSGTPVYNVSLPLMSKLSPERPFHLEEISIATPKLVAASA